MVWNKAPSVPKSILRYLLDKESKLRSGILNFFSDFQEIPIYLPRYLP